MTREERAAYDRGRREAFSNIMGDALAIAAFDGGGAVILRKLDAESVQELDFQDLDNWRMYYERLGLDCLEHAGLLERELARRAPPIDARALVKALKTDDGW